MSSEGFFLPVSTFHKDEFKQNSFLSFFRQYTFVDNAMYNTMALLRQFNLWSFNIMHDFFLTKG